MKFLLLLVVLVSFQRHEQVKDLNPVYNFPDSIMNRKAERYGDIYNKIIKLATSAHYQEARALEDSIANPQTPAYLTPQDDDAKTFILQQAKNYRVLLINEAHYRPEHRMFTKSLLPELRKLGYTVFMAEGIAPENSLHKNAWPIYSDGILVNEPVYGSLLRYAKKLNYAVGGYEYKDGGKWDDSVKLDKWGSIKYISHNPKDSVVLIFDSTGHKWTRFTSVRERTQAANIVHFLKQHPGSKAIIHVGHGHLYEDGTMMGSQLRTLLKEDLLTVDQTMLTERVPVIDTTTHHRLARDRSYIVRGYKVPVDYSILNKTVRDSLNRPGYLFEDVEPRKAFHIPVQWRKNCPCLFVAYYKHEFGNQEKIPIAADLVFIKDTTTYKPLLLPADGKYLVVIKDKEGRVSKPIQIQ